MFKFKKLTALVLFMATVLQLAACANKDDNTQITSDSTDTINATEIIDPATVCELPDKDWGKREFRVLGYEHVRTQFNNFEIFSDGENGDVVNDAVFRRNSTIEEKYNVKIVQTLDSSEPEYNICNANVIRKTVLAQEDLYDLTFTTICSYGALAREGLLYDLNQVDYIDFSKNYLNPEVNKALSCDNKLYFTSSDFTLRDKNRAYILLYNRDMANETNSAILLNLCEMGHGLSMK